MKLELSRTIVAAACLAAALPAAAEELPPPRPRVSTARIEVVRQNEEGKVIVLLNAGSESGVIRGDRFVVLQEERPVGARLVVTEVFREVAVAEVEAAGEGAPPLAEGALAVRIVPPPGEGLAAIVLRSEGGRVLLGRGSSDGVLAGDEFVVLGPDGAERATLRVLEAMPSVSVATVGEGGGELAPGMEARARVLGGAPVPTELSPLARHRRVAHLRAEAERLREEARRLEREADALERREGGPAEPPPPPPPAEPPVIGIQFIEGGGGIRIVGVVEGSGAAAAGLRVDDLVLRIGEREVRDLEDVRAAIAGRRPGESLSFTIRREGWERSVPVRLGRQR